MKFLFLRTKFLNRFLIDRKKYNAINISNNVFYYVNLLNKNNFKILVNFFYIIEPLFFIEKKVYMSQLTKYVSFLTEDQKIHTILNIVNVEEVKSKANEEPQVNIKLAKDLNISTTARLSHEKGWHRIKLLCDEFSKIPNLDWKWFIIGEGHSKNELIKIHALLDKFSQVEFLGKQMNPFPIVKQMDYTALLSDFESWGLVITEGKILGKPQIVTDFPAAYEQVEDSVNGIIVPMNNYNKYAEIANRIVKDKESYKKNLDNFDFEIENQKSVKEWKEILNKERGM